jgi:endonuclease I
MHQQHGVVLEDGEQAMFMEWSLSDPPGDWELERDDRIKAKQGNGNPFVGMFK